MSKIISIDVGIKNLGLCIFSILNNEIDIVKWETVSLVEEVIKKCDGYTSSKKKCTNEAKYISGCEYYCGIHKNLSLVYPENLVTLMNSITN